MLRRNKPEPLIFLYAKSADVGSTDGAEDRSHPGSSRTSKPVSMKDFPISPLLSPIEKEPFEEAAENDRPETIQEVDEEDLNSDLSSSDSEDDSVSTSEDIDDGGALGSKMVKVVCATPVNTPSCTEDPDEVDDKNEDDEEDVDYDDASSLLFPLLSEERTKITTGENTSRRRRKAGRSALLTTSVSAAGDVKVDTPRSRSISKKVRSPTAKTPAPASVLSSPRATTTARWAAAKGLAASVSKVKALLKPIEQPTQTIAASPDDKNTAQWRAFTTAKRAGQVLRRSVPMKRKDSEGEEPTTLSDPAPPGLTFRLPPVRRSRGGDILANVNGLRCFGISKIGITRAVIKFSGPPIRQPLTLCFHFPSTFITHRYVLDMVKSRIQFVPDKTIKAIQFIDRNAIHGTQGLDNRWLVTVCCPEAREELLRTGLNLYNRRIMLRRLDDVLNEEYKEFLQYQELQHKLYHKVEEMIKDKKPGMSIPNIPNSSNMSEEELRHMMSDELKKAAVAAEARR